MKHIFLIKQSIEGNVQELINRIFIACQSLNYDFAIVQAGTDEDIQEIARKCRDKDYIVYAIGDDKDLNLVLNEIVNGRAKLGIIPVGEDNDFYRSLDEYQSDEVKTNVMKVNELYGLNNFNLGFNSDIYRSMEKLRKLHIPSKYLYELSLLYTIFKFKGQVIGVNDYFEKLTLLSVSNGTYFGGGYPIAPRAGIHRGEVSVISLNADIPKSLIPRFWLEMSKRCHGNNSYASFFESSEEIHIETMHELEGLLDGRELVGNEFRVIPSASNTIVVNNRRLIRNISK